MVASRHNMDEEMMDIINTGTQFADGDQQDVDDESQYLALENMQENIVQKKYWRGIYIYIYIWISIIYYVYTWYLFILFLYIALWIDDHNGEKQKIFEARKSHWRGAT